MFQKLNANVLDVTVVARRFVLSFFGLAALAIGLGLAPRARADQFDDMRNYWIWYIANEGGNEQSRVWTGSYSGSSGLASAAQGYLSTMVTNNAQRTTFLWTNYSLGSTSGYFVNTFNNLETMAMAYAQPLCSNYMSTNLSSNIISGLDWIVANYYLSNVTEYGNWWDWEMGAGYAFVNTIALMYTNLTPAQLNTYITTLEAHEPHPPGVTNENMWGFGSPCADMDFACVMYPCGFLSKDSGYMSFVQSNLNDIYGVWNYNSNKSWAYCVNDDGLYADGSCVIHTCFAYTSGYGVEYLSDTSMIINMLSNSTWQLSPTYQNNVYTWVSNIWEPLIYGGPIMDMAHGRYLSRSGASTGDGSMTLYSINEIAAIAPTAVGQSFSNFVNHPLLPPGQYQFPCMDRVVAFRNGFGFAVSMSSARIANYESINGENLQSWFTGDGMTYLYLGTKDTQFTSTSTTSGQDFWPTVDKYHLPGTTVEQVARVNAQNEAGTNHEQWAGGAEVLKQYGTAGMSLSNVISPELSAKKSWFMFDNEIVCLGAAITCSSNAEIDTTVENRRLGTTITNAFWVNGTSNSQKTAWNSNLSNVSWCDLPGYCGYYFPGGATNLKAAFVTNTGSWSAIGGSGGTFTDYYLRLWYNHGAYPTNATYSYVLLPNMNAASVSNYALNPDIVVISNTPDLQAASKPSLGVVAANYWTVGPARSADLISASVPASIITSENNLGISVGVSDPTMTNSGVIAVTLNRAAAAVVSADPGVVVNQLSPQIKLTVSPKGTMGRTFHASFSYASPSLSWDANTTTTGAQDGAGSWQSTSTNWWIGNGNVAWSNATPYDATFGAGGTPGTVTISYAPIITTLTLAPVASDSYTLAASGSGSLSISNGINANATGTLSVPLNLLGDQTWTVASGQTLNINGTVSATPPVNLSLAGPGTVMLNGTGTIGSGPVSVLAGATLAGTGNVSGTLAISGTASPGPATGVGTLSTGDQTWNGGGAYVFRLNNATNNSGWSLLNVNGTINVASTSGSPFTIQLVSLTSGNAPGAVPGFADCSPATWTVATASGGIQNFTSGSVTVNTTAFSNAFTGTFSVTTNAAGTSLAVQYMPPPPAFGACCQTGSQISMNFSGLNGQPFRLLTSPDLSVPLTNWTMVTNGTFGTDAVNFTDDATNAQEFYQLVSP